MHVYRSRARTRTLAVTAALLTVLTTALAATGDVARADQAHQSTLPASEKPLGNTARVMDGHVYGIADNGTTTVVVGDFTTVRDFAYGSANQSRPYVFAYDDATGAVSQRFVPTVDGVVNSVAMVDGGTHVLLGGMFKTVNGQTGHRGIVKLDVSDGSIDPTFTGQTTAGVNDIGVQGDQVYVGGLFDSAGGQRQTGIARLDLATGAADKSFVVSLAGVLNPAYQSQRTQVTELDVSPDGHWLSLLGNFKTVDGADRQQLALVDLTTGGLANWSAPSVGGWPCYDFKNDVTWVKDAEFSPDSQYLVTGASGGFHQGTMCDTVARWELPPSGTGAVSPSWTDLTGGDSIFRVAVTDAGVYAGGHQRWLNNPTPTTATGPTPYGDNDGPGSVQRYGIGVLDPTSGVPLTWFPNRDGSRPKRGFEAIVPTGDKLLLGSDSTVIGGAIRQRLAAFSVAGGPTNPAPEQVVAPATLYALSGGRVYRLAYDGSKVGTPTLVSGPGADGVDWSTTKDAFLQRGSLTSFGTDGQYYRRSFAPGSVGAATSLSQTVGYVDSDNSLTPYDQPYNVDQTKAAAFVGGRILYTRTGSSSLYWRWYSQQSGIIGSEEHTLDSSIDWSRAASLEVVGDRLLAARTDRTLVSYPLSSTPATVSVSSGQPTLVDRSTLDWSKVTGLWAANR